MPNNTDTLVDIFDDIATAINNKGVSGTMTPSQMATKIASIPSGGSGFDVTGLSGVKFAYNTDTSIDLSTLDTSGFTNMRMMFNNCVNLTSLNVSGFDTGNVNTMSYMFSGCSGLTSLDLSSFDTGNVTDMSNMFFNCSGLTSLNVSGFDTGNVTLFSNMFTGCSGLTSFDPSSFDTESATSIGSMFSGCSGLTSLDLSSFDTSSVNTFTGICGSFGRSHITADSLSGSTLSINFQSFTTGAATKMSGMIQTNISVANGRIHVIWAIDSTTVQPLVTANGFDEDNYGHFPYIYVRSSLVNSYKSATNWSRYSSYIKPISQLPAELQTLYNIDPNDYQ